MIDQKRRDAIVKAAAAYALARKAWLETRTPASEVDYDAVTQALDEVVWGTDMAPDLGELFVDEARFESDDSHNTGVYIRARRGNEYLAADIAHLRRGSLLAWAKAKPEAAAELLCKLLGHRPREGGMQP